MSKYQCSNLSLLVYIKENTHSQLIANNPENPATCHKKVQQEPTHKEVCEILKEVLDYPFVSFVQATAKGFVLIQTKEVSMRPEDVKRVFQNNAEGLVEWITKGNL